MSYPLSWTRRTWRTRKALTVQGTRSGRFGTRRTAALLRGGTCELFLRQESRERLPEGGGFTEGQVSTLMTCGVDALMTFDDL